MTEVVSPAPRDKPPLLLLVHRIPYPPNKGDKIRSYHLLRALANDYRVFLGTFVDDPADRAHCDTVRQWCEDACFVDIDPRWRKLASLRGLLSGDPLTLPFYASAQLREWVERVVAEHAVDKAVAFSSATAQFLLGGRFQEMRRVMDFIDIDSDKWAQYSTHKRFPMNWLYRREASRLLQFEQRVARAFDASVFVSPHEAELFRRLAPRSAARVHAIYNGVDLAHFRPGLSLDNPFAAEPEAHHLVFVGAMDYWPNVDAVKWFATEVLPRVDARLAAKFWIVGANPSREVMALRRLPGVKVTGRVDDVRNYVAHASACVAPLRIARGIQNKVLESLAMGKATLVTPQALEGIPALHGEHLYLANTAEALAAGVNALLPDTDLCDRLGRQGRALMEANFAWETNLAGFRELLDVAG